MDFDLSEDQVALVEGFRQFLAGRFPIAVVRGLEAVGGVDRLRWRELAEAGVFGLPVRAERGGVGLGWADAVLAFEQLGRALVPGPLVATALAAALTPDGLAGAVDGTLIVGYVERGDPLLVEYLDALDVLLVGDDDGLWRIEPRTLRAELVPALDPLTPVARVEWIPEGERIGDSGSVQAWRVRGAVLTAAFQLGVATGACDLAVAYAKHRRQFGRPIGAFQAVKHLCADMATRVEVARAIVYFAGVCLDDPDAGDPVRAASAARVLATTASEDNARDCVQVHGGMGYTWEVDAHLYAKRAYVLASMFGTLDDHEEILATFV